MNATRAITVAAILACTVENARSADAPGGATAAIRDGLKPLSFLADSCWEGPMADGKQTMVHCLRWIMDGRYLRDTMRIKGATPEAGGETTYFWDLETKSVRYIYLSTVGAYSTGTAKFDNGKIIFDDERLVGRSGVIHFVTTIAPTGPDSYVQSGRRQGTDGVWKDTTPTSYVRKPLSEGP